VPGDTVVAGLMQALSTVPDLNVSLGLQRTNDNPAFYVSLLRKFATGQADAVQSINRSLAAGDRPSAERIAHTLRGVAGNLGATALQASAEALEANLRHATPEAHTIALLAQMAAQLARLIQALQAVPGLFAIAPTTDRCDLSASERQAAEAIAGQLKVLLANDDSSVTELWETHAHALSALFSNAAHIEAAINAYDFETAITLMEESERARATEALNGHKNSGRHDPDLQQAPNLNG
jgi:two-component system sensor histidine kinase/response regulator